MNRFETAAGTREPVGRSLPRRRVLLAGGAGAAAIAGCVGQSDTDGPGDPNGNNGEDGDVSTGSFRLLVSDQPVAIDEFDSLEVSLDEARVFREGGDEIDEDADDDEGGNDVENESGDGEENGSSDDAAGFTTFDLAGATVDLTEVIGEQAVPVIESELESGRYTKIELSVADIEGIVEGEKADVMVPSDKLQIVKPFEVTPDEELSFVFDINVVRRGQAGGYNLTPVIGESGVAGQDVEVEEVKPDGADDGDPDQSSGGPPDDGEAANGSSNA